MDPTYSRTAKNDKTQRRKINGSVTWSVSKPSSQTRKTSCISILSLIIDYYTSKIDEKQQDPEDDKETQGGEGNDFCYDICTALSD